MSLAQSIKDAIQEGHKQFLVEFESGRQEKLRIDIDPTSAKHFFVYARKSHKYGFWNNIDENGNIIHPLYGTMKSVRSIDKSSRQIIRETAGKAACELEKNGLWPTLLADIKRISLLDDSKFDELENAIRILDSAHYGSEEGKTAYHKAVEITGSLGIDMFHGLKRGIKRINYYSYDMQESKEMFRKALENKEESWRKTWRKGYNNTLSLETTCKDGPKAFYSEEYKDCGNGHYYIAISESHAIFCEDD